MPQKLDLWSRACGMGLIPRDPVHLFLQSWDCLNISVSSHHGRRLQVVTAELVRDRAGERAKFLIHALRPSHLLKNRVLDHQTYSCLACNPHPLLFILLKYS